MPFLAIVWCPDPTAARRVRDQYRDNDAGKIVGVFEFPNRAELTCTGFCGPHRRASGWSRHWKGYMICGACGGRHKKTRQRLVGALFDYLGANLLRTAPALFRTPEGYGKKPTPRK